MSKAVEYINGAAHWADEPGDVYVVTGVLPNGKRFKPIRTTSWQHAYSINLYRGTKWLERNGKRYKLQTVNN